MPNTLGLIMISYGNAECAVEIVLLLTCIVHADEDGSVELMYDLCIYTCSDVSSGGHAHCAVHGGGNGRCHTLSQIRVRREIYRGRL